MAEGEENATWTFFVDSFREKYLGEAQLSGKIQEFMNLKQGKMTVTEYVTKFTELARFAPTIVPTDDARKRKFMLGLRVEVAKQIDGVSHGPRSYADAVQRALRNESWDRIEPKTAPNKEEMALVPIERSMPNGVKRSYEAPTEGSYDFDVTISEVRSSVVEATEIESETVGVRTEREEALAGTPRRKDECRVHLDL